LLGGTLLSVGPPLQASEKHRKTGLFNKKILHAKGGGLPHAGLGSRLPSHEGFLFLPAYLNKNRLPPRLFCCVLIRNLYPDYTTKAVIVSSAKTAFWVKSFEVTRLIWRTTGSPQSGCPPCIQKV